MAAPPKARPGPEHEPLLMKKLFNFLGRTARVLLATSFILPAGCLVMTPQRAEGAVAVRRGAYGTTAVRRGPYGTTVAHRGAYGRGYYGARYYGGAAGVARRTTRRAVRRNYYYNQGYYYNQY